MCHIVPYMPFSLSSHALGYKSIWSLRPSLKSRKRKYYVEYLTAPCPPSLLLSLWFNQPTSSLASRYLWSWSVSLPPHRLPFSLGYHFLTCVTEIASIVFTQALLIPTSCFPSLTMIILSVRWTALRAPNPSPYTHIWYEIAILLTKGRN